MFSGVQAQVFLPVPVARWLLHPQLLQGREELQRHQRLHLPGLLHRRHPGEQPRLISNTHTHTHTHTLVHAHSHTPSRTFSLTVSSQTHTLSHWYTLTHTLLYTLSHSLSLTLTRTITHSHTPSHTHSQMQLFRCPLSLRFWAVNGKDAQPQIDS